ncbi:hypothetical protein HTZ84_22160 [Haloterrigena sp. SYSU A558-1]|uniref:Uncharacterized protein n=1 Tax=Haloterrigena gelatinilytica TaxID=2741724 RepID=A0ABX2LMT4_9EURY|nr:hypothetical protein [Haloterrigena gelatinilytica]NUC74972.1 hypothetical protein [Haloterrigena gelatinilytica]
MNGRYNAGDGQTNEFPKLKATHGEDPARWLESSELMATARIRGIRDPELLEAYHAVAKQITAGKFRESILEAIAERKADLGLVAGDELADAPTPDATADPVPATDGGTELSHSEEETDTAEPEVSDVAIHPDAAGLEAGEVLVLERGERTEYIFPATADAAEPYLARIFADGDERTPEPVALSFDEVLSRFEGSPDSVPLAEIDVDAPRGAATGGDA